MEKILLQSQEPVKCLCRSYLVNSVPNPFKNRLYVMITQTPHSPFTTVLPSLSTTSSISSNIRSVNNDQQQHQTSKMSSNLKLINNSNSNKNENVNHNKRNNNNNIININTNIHHRRSSSKSPKAPLILNKKRKSLTPPNIKGNGHFVRKPIQSISHQQSSKSNLNVNIPSSSVCGQTFSSPTECHNHQKQCKDCNHRIVTIRSNQ